jgi:hypothetical protein
MIALSCVALLLIAPLGCGGELVEEEGNEYETFFAGGNAKYLRGTIEIDNPNPVWGDRINYLVTTNARKRDLYDLWVQHRCVQNGVTVQLVFWPIEDGKAGPIGLIWRQGGAAECRGFVQKFASNKLPHESLILDYTVAAQ